MLTKVKQVIVLGLVGLGACASEVEDDGISAEQAAIVADGVVTFDEYKGAVEATVACYRAAGLEVLGPTLDRHGIFFSTAYATVPGKDVEGQAAALACEARYLVPAVDRTYNAAHWQSEEVDAANRERVATCVRDQGVALSRESLRSTRDVLDAVHAHLAAAAQDKPAIDECLKRYRLNGLRIASFDE